MSPIVKPTKTTKPAPTKVRASINPDNASLGLIDDVDVTITDVMTADWDYNGQQPVGPAMCVEFTDANNTEHQQWYSAGKAEDWAATEDGESFESVSGKTQINIQTNFMQFMKSMVESGFPKDDLGENVKVMIGTKCHVNQVAIERPGLIRKDEGPNTRPKTTLLVTSIIALPGADHAGAGAKKGAVAGTTKAAVGGRANGAAKTTPAAEPAADAVDEKITAVLLELLSEGEVPKKKVGPAIFQAFKDDPKNRNRAVTRASSNEFLAALKSDGVIAYDGATLSLPE